MKTRPARLFLALCLLAMIWPAFAVAAGTTLAATVGLVAGHPAVLVAVVAAVLLLGVVPGPVDRALTRLAHPASKRSPR